MESGSLLADALRYMQHMQQVHQNENSLLPFDVLQDKKEEEEGSAVAWQGKENNSIIFSLYCIDDRFEAFYERCDGDVNTTRTRKDEKSKCLKELQQRLAYIQTIIHGRLKPLYQQRYAHTWFSGGEGMSFGIHCAGIHNSGNEKGEDLDGKVPHLRALVKYGPHPMDEQYALALILNLSRDLYTQYQIITAVSCWDVDDGQILLIEGADSIPDWVDDVVGVEGMTNRVYVVNGKIQILDPSIKSSKEHQTHNNNYGNDQSIYNLTVKQSLLSTMSKMKENNGEKEITTTKLNDAIHEWLKPFLSVTNERMDLNTKRTLLKDYVQTAAIVLPLRIALLIQQRPDLMSCAILQFCAKAPDELLDKKRKKKLSSEPSSTTTSGDLYSIQFENLVFTTITISKSLYAMLLTAAGQIPPPIKIPKQYKSVELNRMKRQCLLGGEGYAHFRHAIEIGLRLTLGFEWILKYNNGKGTSSNVGKQIESKHVNAGSVESRIAHHCFLDKESGGDGGKWIQAAWRAGPNAISSDENDISNIVKCPVWYPEISNGGICPLTHNGMSVCAHVKNALRGVDKKDLDAINTTVSFPFPRMEDVDSDSWIDMNSIDELEAKMSEMTTGMSKKTSKGNNSKKDEDTIEMDSNLNEMKKMMSGLDSFVNKESEVEGVVTKSKEIVDDKISTTDDFDLSQISPKIFLTMMHKVLKAKTTEEINDFSELNDDTLSIENDRELLQYFTRADLNLIGDENAETKETDPVSMEDIMNAMDQELLGEKDVDRTFKVPTTTSATGTADDNTEKSEDTGNDDIKLPFDDPTAIQSNVISNLLESLDAQDGKSGPVSNILKEMGMKPPGEN